MKWLKITVVFFLVTLVKCGPTRSEKDPGSETDPGTGPPVPIKITSIEKVDVKTKICIADDAITKDEIYTLAITTKEKTKDYQATEDTDLKCITFMANLEDWTNQENYEFIVHSDKYPGNYAEGTITNFPKAPITLEASLGKDPVISSTYLLRIEGDNLDNLVMENPPDLLVKESNIKYYKGITESTYTVRKCYTTQPDNIKVCVGDINVAAEDIDQTITNATLAIENPPSTTADINLKILNEDASDIYDIILSTTATGSIILCPGRQTPLSCQFERDTIDQKIDIRVIKLDAGKNIVETSNAYIQDRNLILNLLVDDILEGIWTHKSETDKFYQFLRVVTGEKNKSMDVDCRELTEEHCYGYTFAKIGSDNIMKLRPRNGKDFSYIDENQNVYPNVPLLHQDLEVHILHKTWQQNFKTINTKICFKHANTTKNMNFSHYEMLLINKKGQWMKQKTLENNGAGDLCFTPLTINMDDFDVTKGTKVIISQRGIDGITVLASGGTDLF